MGALENAGIDLSQLCPCGSSGTWQKETAPSVFTDQPLPQQSDNATGVWRFCCEDGCSNQMTITLNPTTSFPESQGGITITVTEGSPIDLTAFTCSGGEQISWQFWTGGSYAPAAAPTVATQAVAGLWRNCCLGGCSDTNVPTIPINIVVI